MNFPKELKYTRSHEWARKTGNKVTVGITEYAQKEISDVVFVELPKSGKNAEQGKGIAVVESVKAAFDIYAPMSGSITRFNQQLESDPGLVNSEPYGEGWFFEIEISNESEWDQLLSSEEYQNHLKQDVH